MRSSVSHQGPLTLPLVVALMVMGRGPKSKCPCEDPVLPLSLGSRRVQRV